jgi:GTP cyclohydrolase I
MPHLDFKYDGEYYPEDGALPDPQIDPFIPGSRVALNKVGVSGVDLPVQLKRRDGEIQTLHARVSLYGSLDNPEAKGLNLSRFPILMTETIANHLSIEGLKDVLVGLREKQGSNDVYCKLAFKYPWTQEALRTRKELPTDADPKDIFKTVEGVNLSHDKMVGHIFYDCILEGQLHKVPKTFRKVVQSDQASYQTPVTVEVDEFRFFLTVNYVYSSTCPCSFELAQDATQKRGVAANGHSQRSIAKLTVQFDPDKEIVWIEDVVEMARRQVPTEVVIICKRRDEQAFAELNGSNLLFTEDAARLLYQGFDEWFKAGKISDFSIVTDHIESLHPWNATAVVSKGVAGGLR